MSSIEVFICYSHQDKKWGSALTKHLAVLERFSVLQVWIDDRVNAGAEWVSEIQRAIASARIAVFLISVDFLNSDFIQQEEVRPLLERRERQELYILPVIVRDCVWEEVPWLKSLQLWPQNGKPLAARRGNGIDAELKGIAQEVLKIVRQSRLHPRVA